MEHTQTAWQQAGTLMKDFIDTTLRFYAQIDEREVSRQAAPETLARLREQGIPRFGRPAADVYAQMLAEVYPYATLEQHPRCFSCIPSPISPFSWMGDVMTNAFDPHAGCLKNAASAGVIEQELIQWLCAQAGYPSGCGGLFVSGGSMANLTALTAARDARLSEQEWGLGVAYVSDQTHSSVAKGLHILGFRADQIRKIPSDDQFRMDLTALETAVREDLDAGRKPFCIVATAGTTNTGSVDPLPEIAALCRTYGLWMHVDGAFGASLLLSKRCRRHLAGIELSDSLSWDAHKWLMQTYGCSMVLVRSQASLVHSFAANPEYLRDSGSETAEPNFWDLGPELTRPARALKLWMTLQVTGSEQIGRMIDHGCALAQLAQELLSDSPDWEILSPACHGILNFRYAPAGISEEEADRINQALSQEITASGYAHLLTTVLHGKKALRMCILHPDTTEEDIRTVLAALQNSALLREPHTAKRKVS